MALLSCHVSGLGGCLGSPLFIIMMSMIYLIAQEAVNGWVQAGVVVAIITVVLDRVFALIKPLIQKRNGNGGGCEAAQQIRSVFLRGRKPEQALIDEKEKDDALKQMAKDIGETKDEQKRTRRLVQADLAQRLGCNPNELNPDETGVGMPAIKD